MSVTAVPLQPLTRGTLLKLGVGLLLLVLIGAGLAWVGSARLQYSRAEDGVRFRATSAGTGEVLGRDDIARAQAELRLPRGQIITSTERILNPETGEVGVLMPIVLEETRSPIRVPDALKGQIREGGKYQVLGPASQIVGPVLPPGVSAGDQIELRLKVVDIERGRLGPLRQQRQQQQQQRRQSAPSPQGGAPQLPRQPGGPR